MGAEGWVTMGGSDTGDGALVENGMTSAGGEWGFCPR
jgi:hypothetical protein